MLTSHATFLKPNFSHRVLHLLFWTIITLVFIYDRRYLIIKFNLPEHFIACVVVRMGLLVSLVYFHLNVLVPRFFKTRQFFKYTTILLFSLGIYVSLQNLYDIYLYGFVIGDIRSRDFWSAFPYNFFTTLWYLALTAGLKLSLERYGDMHKSEPILNPPDTVSDQRQKRQVFLKSGTKQVMVELDSITHIKGLKDYSIVYTTEDQIIVKGSLKNAEYLLSAKKLIRVHKSYLVALDRIRTIQGNHIILDTQSIPIGRFYKKELYKLLMPSRI
ncbi:LytR/AlgR family response regulator transcription factor [Algoriphagus sp.]|uniref:LytR/AlgR family response regulator transcription factor n=1 Tax=Algoriphagus sp. TaxID=1872435 RepID=UPI003F6F7B8F